MDPPELTNFGSLVRFALSLEDAAVSFFEGLATVVMGEELQGLVRELADQHRQRRKVLEQTRARVNEMILEPISGLDGGRYVFDAGPADRAEAIARGVSLEETAARFYSESATVAKALLAEAARAFRKFGEDSARNAVRLRMAPR